jgi:ADP-ribose pyrophosphatase
MIERAGDLQVIEKTAAYEGYFRIDRYRLRHRLFDGGWSGEVTREVFERGHAAAVLPYDPARDEVVLIEQFRVGAHAAGRDPWPTEIVAGIIEEGEEAGAVARREALEEAGCQIGELAEIARVLVSPGGTSQTTAIYCGRTVTAGLGGIHGIESEHEDIRVSVVPFEDAWEMVRAGHIEDCTTLIALQWLALNRTDLRARWA